MAAWFKFGRGVKSSPDNLNRSFKGDGSAYPVWDMLGYGHPNARQIYTVGALDMMPVQIGQMVTPTPAQSPVTYGAIENPFVNMGSGLDTDAS